MKKLLTLLTFTLITLTSYSQNIFYFRAFELNYGTRVDSESPITWSEDATPVNILIKVEDTKAIIYSKETQVYRLINQVESGNDRMYKYLCSNDDGLKCNFMIFTHEDAKGIIFIAVEFNDMVFYYATKPE